ncbi:hypothetical protein MYX82_05040 [Acidobacteria bacterium AH-259-D05]|nr:hypothetical protein [Acidobacteria bacterium AH-259-D05]
MERKVVVKVIESKRRILRDPTLAYQLANLIDEYYIKLRQLSREFVPPYCECELVPLSPDESEVLLLNLCPYQGMSLEEALLDNVLSAIQALRYILEFLNFIFPTVGDDGHTSIGIDLKPANFCLDQRGSRAIYIDFMPPRVKDRNGRFWTEYPYVKNPHGIWMYYTPKGMILTLLCQLARLSPENWPVFVQEIILWLETEGFHGLSKWLSEQTKTLERPSVIESLDNPILLRLAACKLAFLNPEFRPQLESFYKLTHFEGGDHKALLDPAKCYLQNFLQKSSPVMGSRMLSPLSSSP